MTAGRDEARRRALLRWAIVGLAVGFLGLNAALLLHTGIRIGGDSSRYIGGAEELLQGRLRLGSYYWAYGTHTAVVAAMQAIGAGLPGVVGVQIGVAAIAGLALAAMAAALGGPAAGGAGAAFLLVNPDVVRWHAYILTESLYALVAAHLLVVAATLADHDGRFLLHVLGPIAVLAGPGFATLARRGKPRPCGPLGPRGFALVVG
jgi:hypothetical protein